MLVAQMDKFLSGFYYKEELFNLAVIPTRSFKTHLFSGSHFALAAILKLAVYEWARVKAYI